MENLTYAAAIWRPPLQFVSRLYHEEEGGGWCRPLESRRRARAPADLQESSRRALRRRMLRRAAGGEKKEMERDFFTLDHSWNWDDGVSVEVAVKCAERLIDGAC